AFFVMRVARRQLHARLVRELLDRLGKREPLRLHHEGENVAMRPAAEAVIKPLLLVHRERRRLLIVKRAQPDLIMPTPNKPNLAPHHFGDTHPIAQFVQETWAKAHYRSP